MKLFGMALIATASANRMRRSAWHWGYENGNGADWSSHEAECGKDRQSPIDIPAATAEMPLVEPFQTSGYDSPLTWEATNNGHGIAIAVPAGERIAISGGGLSGDYVLAQFHFHWGSATSEGSEHLVDGQRHFAEIHLVHYKEDYGSLGHSITHDDGLAVLGFFVDVNEIPTAPDDPLDSLIQFKIGTNVAEIDSQTPIDMLAFGTLSDILMTASYDNYYRYLGSLTTPTCNEAVVWTVFKDPIIINTDTKNALLAMAKFDAATADTLTDNFRVPQPLGDRVVTFYSTSVTEEKAMPVTPVPAPAAPAEPKETMTEKMMKFFKLQMIMQMFSQPTEDNYYSNN